MFGIIRLFEGQGGEGLQLHIISYHEVPGMGGEGHVTILKLRGLF